MGREIYEDTVQSTSVYSLVEVKTLWCFNFCRRCASRQLYTRYFSLHVSIHVCFSARSIRVANAVVTCEIKFI